MQATLEALETLWPWLVAGSGVLTVLLVVASLVGLPWVLAGLPVDILHHEPPPARPTRRLLLNGLGWSLILLGILMLVLPGQGLLSILAGALVADVPGKRRWVVWALSRPPVARAVDAIRARRDAPPLEPL